jgi:hypothetical protein
MGLGGVEPHDRQKSTSMLDAFLFGELRGNDMVETLLPGLLTDGSTRAELELVDVVGADVTRVGVGSLSKDFDNGLEVVTALLVLIDGDNLSPNALKKPNAMSITMANVVSSFDRISRIIGV